jgi:hypothetical protein
MWCGTRILQAVSPITRVMTATVGRCKRSAKLMADASVLDRFDQLSHARNREAELRGRPGTDMPGDRRCCIE